VKSIIVRTAARAGRKLRRVRKEGRAVVKGAGLAIMAAAALPAVAFAQAASPAGSIGAQLNSISGEAVNSGGQFGSMAMYLAAIICFVGGAWALWASRHEQNRGGGKIGMGIAGLVLAGLFATGPTWIGKASVTTSGGAATITNTPQTFQFQ
jgi:hypothetical protein